MPKINYLGFDFGTSNSATAICENGKPKIVTIEQNKTNIPTALFFDFDIKQKVYGNAASRALLDGDEGRYMRALKSVLGTSLMSEKRVIFGKKVDFYDIISDYISHFKQKAEAEFGKVFDGVISGRPVNFHSEDEAKNKQAELDLKRCYEMAGFKAVEFMFEPVAAAHNYQFGNDEEVGLVVDIGGGTSDYCVFKSVEGKLDILATHGTRIGGTDFDKSFSFDHFMPLLGLGSKLKKVMSDGDVLAPTNIYHDLAKWEKIPFAYSDKNKDVVATLIQQAYEPKLFKRLALVLEERLGHELAFSAERSKIALNKGNAKIGTDLSFIESKLIAIVERIALDQMMQQYCDKISSDIEYSLELSGLKKEQIDHLIFVGGSSQMQQIQNAAQKILPDAKVHMSNINDAIVDGLAIVSETKF